MPSQEPETSKDDSPQRRSRPDIRSLETVGILIVVMCILLYVLARHWHQIPWSAR